MLVQLVQFGIYPTFDHATLGTQNGRIFAEFGFDFLQKVGTRIQLIGVLTQYAGRFFGLRFALLHRMARHNRPTAQHLLDRRDL